MGFGSFGEYVERLFGYGRRCTQEKLRVAEALEQLPALVLALDEGALSWSAVREITRVAVPETERAWLEVAYGKTVRQLEDLVAGRREGDAPDSPPDRSVAHLGRVDMQLANDALADGRVEGNVIGAARGRAHVGARAKQNVPPAVRRAVLRRDHQRCRVPGCRNATFLDLHHIGLRSEGGSHTPTTF